MDSSASPEIPSSAPAVSTCKIEAIKDQPSGLDSPDSSKIPNDDPKAASSEVDEKGA